MRNGSVDDRNLDKILLGILNTFLDSRSYLVCLTKAVTYDTVLVAYYYDSSEAEVTATLGDFGYPLYVDKSLFKFKIRCLYSFNICICHNSD